MDPLTRTKRNADAAPEDAVQQHTSGGQKAALAAFVFVAAAVSYAGLGNRNGWSAGPADTRQAAVDAEPIDAMVARLEARLKWQPDDAEGWAMLARSYTVLGRDAEALPALKRVIELRPGDARALADYADGLAAANGRSFTGEPEERLRQALQIDPDNVKALVLSGTAAIDRGDAARAAALWERALSLSAADEELRRLLESPLAQARQRAGQGMVASVSVAPAAAAPDAFVAGRVTLTPAARAAVAPNETVFVFVRAAGGARMPLAVLRAKVTDLPLNFRLDDSLAMSPTARLSSAPQVVVGARISRSGSPAAQTGDWQAISEPVPLGSAALQLEIGERVP